MNHDEPQPGFERDPRYSPEHGLAGPIEATSGERTPIEIFADELPRDALPPRRGLFRRIGVPLILFLATGFSTFVTGGLMARPVQIPGENGGPPHLVVDMVGFLNSGLLYGGAVMAILTAHEMGHFLQSRRYRVPASLPYFIPMPISPFGTMGAVIFQHAGVANRRALFDIAISGPLAGLVLALPLTVWGVVHSEIAQIRPGSSVYGDPLLIQWIVRAVHAPLPAGYGVHDAPLVQAWGRLMYSAIPHGFDVQLTPLLFAGWVGIFITGLNLIPIGQLDGGHILYTLLKKKAHRVAFGFYAAAATAIILGGPRYYGWIIMMLLIGMTGVRHPPTANDSVPLGRFRTWLGWLTLSFIIIGFTPTPIIQE